MTHPDSTRRALVKSLPALALTPGDLLAAPEARPNIVFIVADDLGYADLSVYGQADFTTPNLDRMAAQGARLTQAYANSAVCSATRFGLITGRYQYRCAAAWKNRSAPPGAGACRPGIRPSPPC